MAIKVVIEAVVGEDKKVGEGKTDVFWLDSAQAESMTVINAQESICRIL